MRRPFVLILCLLLLTAVSASAQPCPSVDFTLEQTLGDYPAYVEDLQTVDYDHDGKLDLVGGIVQNDGFAVLHSWRGKGDGTFEDAVSLGDTKVMDLQVINVNGDSYEDLVGASYDFRFWVRLGNATGFDAAITTFTNYAVYEIKAGNFNEGTASIDVVTSSLTSGLFVVYQGNGNGTFTETRRVSAGASNWITGHVVADFDNDTRFDVALTRRVTETVEVYFRNADGTFASPVSMAGGNWPEEIASGDFNEDGLADLATVNWEGGTIDVYQNAGSRAFSAAQTLDGSMPGHGGGLDSIELVDINADGNLDILAGAVNGSWLTTYLGNGSGGFTVANWLELPDGVFSIAAGNFDGATDSDLELALGSYGVLFTADYACASQVHLYSVAPMIHTSQSANFVAVVSGISASTPLPRGTVTFKEGTTTLGTGDVGADGVATLEYSGLAAGNHTITAEFGGNSVLGIATSDPYVQKVTASKSSVQVVVPPNTHGEPFNAQVNITSQFGFETEGYYYLTLDGVTETTRRWSGATLSLVLNAGEHTISAEFVGDTQNPPAVSPVVTFTTAKHAVSMTALGTNNVRLGDSHNLQITVTATTSPAPSGPVELYRGTTSIGTAYINSGIAAFYVTLPRGSYECTAVYAGDANYLTNSITFTLNVLGNAPVYIDAYALDSAIAIPAVVPNDASSAVMYRRVSGGSNWTAVPSWSLGSQIDSGAGLTRGVLYDYRLDVMVNGNLQQSNIDSALLYTDPAITAGTTKIKLAHFAELRDSINALRAMAGLTPFAFDGTFGANGVIRASHVTALRNAAAQARSALGMVAATFTDPTLTNLTVKRVHVMELRNAAR
jgi:Bacterial Ig-like domain (group 3)/FG-GAP-like repeat